MENLPDAVADHAIAAAFTDVAREWLTEELPNTNQRSLDMLSARNFVRAVEARAAQYAAEPPCTYHVPWGPKCGLRLGDPIHVQPNEPMRDGKHVWRGDAT